MPKKVDLAEIKNQIAKATWQVILKNGIDKIQNIASGTKISVGRIQHYFLSKEQLIHYANGYTCKYSFTNFCRNKRRT